MTLIDTSAWIEFLRPTGNPQIKTEVGDLVQSGRAAFTCPIRYELLSGARENEKGTLDLLFDVAHHHPTKPDDWNRAAEVRALLIRKGVTVPLADLLIFCVAERCGMTLLARDTHFDAIAEVVHHSSKA
jgi:predicted nucleic acid-binding protein